MPTGEVKRDVSQSTMACSLIPPLREYGIEVAMEISMPIKKMIIKTNYKSYNDLCGNRTPCSLEIEVGSFWCTSKTRD
jgi:hypothetical protein